MITPYLIIDSNSLCYRSFYTLPELTVEEVPIFVVFGFARQLLSLAKEFETNKFIFCFDSKENHRKEIYPTYKMKRREKKTPEEVGKLSAAFKQFNFIRRKFLPELGFRNIFCQSGFEADDIMAQLVYQYNYMDFVIVTTDTDMYQCISNKTSVWNYKKLMTIKAFTKLYGIEPSLWPLAKAIGGCNSDNVEGIAGISDPAKSKAKIIPAIQLAAGDGTPTQVKKIKTKESRDIIKRNLELISLPLVTEKYKMSSMQLTRDEINRRKFIDVFENLQFKSLLKDFEKWEEYFALA